MKAYFWKLLAAMIALALVTGCAKKDGEAKKEDDKAAADKKAGDNKASHQIVLHDQRQHHDDNTHDYNQIMILLRVTGNGMNKAEQLIK